MERANLCRWLDGFRWDHTERHVVRSLDAQLLIRVIATGSHLPLRVGMVPGRRIVGMVALRLSTIRALCQATEAASPLHVSAYHESPPRWFAVKPRAKRKEALKAEEELTLLRSSCLRASSNVGRRSTVVSMYEGATTGMEGGDDDDGDDRDGGGGGGGGGGGRGGGGRGGGGDDAQGGAAAESAAATAGGTALLLNPAARFLAEQQQRLLAATAAAGAAAQEATRRLRLGRESAAHYSAAQTAAAEAEGGGDGASGGAKRVDDDDGEPSDDDDGGDRSDDDDDDDDDDDGRYDDYVDADAPADGAANEADALAASDGAQGGGGGGGGGSAGGSTGGQRMRFTSTGSLGRSASVADDAPSETASREEAEWGSGLLDEPPEGDEGAAFVRLRFRCWTGPLADTRLPGEPKLAGDEARQRERGRRGRAESEEGRLEREASVVVSTHLGDEADPSVVHRGESEAASASERPWALPLSSPASPRRRPTPPRLSASSPLVAPRTSRESFESLPVPTLSALSFLSEAASPRASFASSLASATADGGVGPTLGAAGATPRRAMSDTPPPVAVRVVGHEPVYKRDVRAHVRYAIAVGVVAARGSGEPGGAEVAAGSVVDAASADEGWQVWRRFSQFVELDHELHAKGWGEELQRVRARLPSKFQLPFGLQAEGDERTPRLALYLKRLTSSPRLRRSEQLKFFLAQTETHRRRWRAANE